MVVRKALGMFPENKFVAVWLNGLVHTTDRLAVKEIVRKFQMEAQIDCAKPSNVSDCLRFVIETLNLGSKENVPVVFVLEEFDLFALHPKQALLYTLLDISQTCVNPVFVIGTSQRQDALDLLEKRVKSRFSHQLIFTHASRSIIDYKRILLDALTLREHDRVSDCNYSTAFNQKMEQLFENSVIDTIIDSIEKGCADLGSLFRIFTLQLLNLTKDSPFMTTEGLKAAYASQLTSPLQDVFNGLSPLEQMLVTAIKHCIKREIHVFNFEIVNEFYRDFLATHSAKDVGMLSFKKDVVFKV
ncbi:origin recognition complex subunit 4 [Entophlyctis luteolus]|nr:origin recognition complex subunit 4 [Entophlyctis luteolus]